MIPTRPGLLPVVAVVSLGLAIAACSDEDTGTGDDAVDDAGVVATTTIWADIAANVGCDALVPSVIPAGADPHTFEPSLRDREQLGAAAAVIANGSGLEASLIDVLDTVAADGTLVIEMTTRIDVLDDDTHDDDTHDDDTHDDDTHDDDTHDDEHAHSHGEDGDPHVWLDPRRVAGTLDVIAEVMSTAPGADLDAVRQCAEVYRAELEAVDAQIEALLAPIPDDRRVLVTGHDSLAYFADRYGFEVVGAVIPSTSTMAESSAAGLAQLADTIEEYDVPAIFTDSLESDVDAAALADRLGIAVVPLHTGSLDADGPAATYVGMLRSDAEAIFAALVDP